MKHRRRAFIFADAVIGLTVIGIIAGLLAVAVNRQHAAMSRLANSRAASDLAQSAVSTLQQGRAFPGDPRIEVLVLAPPQEAGGEAISNVIGGKRWVQVRATLNGHTEQLIALVPKEKLP